MPNVRLILEYDGSGFHGWQRQPGFRTVEEELHRALSVVMHEPVPWLLAAGRTDSGVHARGQVVNFHCDHEPDLGRLMRSLSSLLRPEVAVVAADIVPDDFHATRSAKCKQYSYRIFRRAVPPVLDYGRVWYIAGPLDIERMQAEAVKFVGEHDFASFRGQDSQSRTNVRTIYESELTFEPPYLIYRVVGSGFLKQMVRNMVGTLVGLGKGVLELKSIEEILAAKNRRLAGMTAPAHGLCMDWVRY